VTGVNAYGQGAHSGGQSPARRNQRFTRQIESVRSEALAVGERQDIGPKADVRRQTPGQRPGRRIRFPRAVQLSRVGAMIPRMAVVDSQPAPRPIPGPRVPAPMRRGRSAVRSPRRQGGSTRAAVVGSCARTDASRRIDGTDVPGGGCVTSDPDLEPDAKRPHAHAGPSAAPIHREPSLAKDVSPATVMLAPEGAPGWLEQVTGLKRGAFAAAISCGSSKGSRGRHAPTIPPPRRQFPRSHNAFDSLAIPVIDRQPDPQGIGLDADLHRRRSC